MPTRCTGRRSVLVGRHDFTTFRSAQCQADSPVKTLDRLDCAPATARRSRSRRPRAPSSTIRCARWSAASQLVGRGKWTKADLKAALEARDRAALGFNAPPDGLYFVGGALSGRAMRRRPARTRAAATCRASATATAAGRDRSGPRDGPRPGGRSPRHRTSRSRPAPNPGRSRAASAASGPRNQALIGVTKPFLRR